MAANSHRPSSLALESPAKLLDLPAIVALQTECVTRWHEAPLDNPYNGLERLVCQNHQFNFLIWHEEDIARSREVVDSRIAEVKRNIDRYNQARNDEIEKLDEALSALLDEHGISYNATASVRTETPGSAIDRLSIMALRVFHYEEELAREDASAEHIDKVAERLKRCRWQQEQLAFACTDLWNELVEGSARLIVYRQMKMYNDPTLNPQLYRATKAQRGSQQKAG